MVKRPPFVVRLRVFLRLFFVQACWNTRSMLGHGFAFAMIPALRWLHSDPESFRSSLSRHVTHFNAHPYLAPLGIGAVIRLEAEGKPPQHIEHFKTAIRGPLGGLGDRLIWAGWLPAVSLVALVLVALEKPPGWVLVTFLVVFNLGHLALRFWSVKAGYEAGFNVASKLKDAGLDSKAEALGRLTSLLLGFVMGLLASASVSEGLGLWLPLAGALFLVGVRARRRAWRPAALLTAGVVVLIGLVGVFQ